MLLGYPYNTAIDMWSLGCMAAELFLGLPLFPGASEHDLLTRMVDMLGIPPDHVLERAQHTHRYFRCGPAAAGARLSTLQACTATRSCPGHAALGSLQLLPEPDGCWLDCITSLKGNAVIFLSTAWSLSKSSSW